jgi:hypothetical protein
MYLFCYLISEAWRRRIFFLDPIYTHTHTHIYIYIYIYIYMVHSIHIVDDKAPNVFTNVEKKLGSASHVHQKGKNQIPFWVLLVHFIKPC